MIKRVVFCCLLFVFLFNGFTVSAESVSKHGQLKANDIHLVDQKGDQIVLRGVGFGWHNWWPRLYNAGAAKWLVTDWECTVTQAAKGVEPTGAYLSIPEKSEKLICDVVDVAIAGDAYVIIDWCSHNIRLEEAKAFFQKIASQCGKYPHVICEIFNEPEHQSREDVKAYSGEVIKTIRAIDPDNIILVGPPHWDQDVDIAAADPVVGYTSLMYSLHCYAATHKQNLRDKADMALNKGLSYSRNGELLLEIY